MKFQAVIFDLFGTLVDDFATSVGQTYTELAMALGVPYEQFMQFWRQTTEMRTAGVFQTVEASIEHVCGQLGVQLTVEQLNNAVKIRLQLVRQTLKPKPDAVATLSQLRNKGHKLALLSNCSIEIPLVWHETVFANSFDSAIFSSRERLKKPDPRIYHLACERLGVMPERCLYIADGENYELAAAAKVGIHPVLIRTSSQETRSELRREASEWQGTAITALPEVIKVVGV